MTALVRRASVCRLLSWCPLLIGRRRRVIFVFVFLFGARKMSSSNAIYRSIPQTTQRPLQQTLLDILDTDQLNYALIELVFSGGTLAPPCDCFRN